MRRRRLRLPPGAPLWLGLAGALAPVWFVAGRPGRGAAPPQGSSARATPARACAAPVARVKLRRSATERARATVSQPLEARVRETVTATGADGSTATATATATAREEAVVRAT